MYLHILKGKSIGSKQEEEEGTGKMMKIQQCY